MKKFKKVIVTFVIVIVLLAGCTIFNNRNTPDMTPRQKALKTFYPGWMKFTKLVGINSAQMENENIQPPVSFYTLHATTNEGDSFSLALLSGVKVLIVNTASDCGYTNQYAELEELYKQYTGKLVVLAFPANDFKGQEKGTDAAIATFCKKNYGVSFPIMTKSVVIKAKEQNEVYHWLSNTAGNGWNNKAPSWNFSKYLINEKGQLTHYFDPSISPLSEEVKAAINKN